MKWIYTKHRLRDKHRVWWDRAMGWGTGLPSEAQIKNFFIL